MKDLLIYAAQVVFCSGVFMLFYHVALAGRTSFRTGRLYLVAAMASSLVIPALEIPVFPAHTVYIAPATVSVGNIEAVVVPVKALTSKAIVMIAYISVAALMLGFMAAELVGIWRLRRRSHSEKFRGYNIYSSPDVRSPFSFGHSIYVGDALDEAEYRQIISHELSHIRHHHSAEKTFMSLVRIVQWYNPFAWLSHRWLRELHEYEADSDVLASGCDMTDYQKLILKQVLGYNPDITCGLNNSLTKKRFIMMTRQKKSKGALLRAACGVMLAGILVVSFGFTRMATRYVSADNPPAVDVSALAGQNGKTPLFILDGTEVNESIVRALNVERIKVVNVLKDKAAKEKYGRKGKKGVVEITLLTADELAAKSTSLGEIVVVGYGNQNDIVDNPGEGPRNEVVSIVIQGNNVAMEIQNNDKQSADNVTVVGTVAVGHGDKKNLMRTAQMIENPMIIVDGVKVSKAQMEAINPDEIESISVLKDKTAVDKYGKEAENGVVLITLKKNAGESTVVANPVKEGAKTYSEVDEMPQFPGGDQELLRWLAMGIFYPDEARKNHIEGMVVVRFVVDESGNVVEPQVLKSPHKLLSDEAIRVISDMPKWTPGKKDGKPARVYYTAPLYFKMEENKAVE